VKHILTLLGIILIIAGFGLTGCSEDDESPVEPNKIYTLHEVEGNWVTDTAILGFDTIRINLNHADTSYSLKVAQNSTVNSVDTVITYFESVGSYRVQDTIVTLYGDTCKMLDEVTGVLDTMDCGAPVPIKIDIVDNEWMVHIKDLGPILLNLGIDKATVDGIPDFLTVTLKKD